MNRFILGLIFLSACANLERGDDAPVIPDAGLPPDGHVKGYPDATLTPDAPPPPPDGGVCHPECDCDNDCPAGDRCWYGHCYERCSCDDDCSGPGNQSCDHGLCKGH